MADDRTPEVGILMYSGCQTSAALAITDLFLVSNRFSSPGVTNAPGGISVSQWKVEEGGTVPRRVADADSNSAGPSSPDLLLVPPSLQAPITRQDAMPYLGWLRERHAAGCILASVCAGTFLLGETGLLDGRPATTHWVLEDQFRDRFPAVILDVDRLLIDGGQILTAGGLMAWTDLCLRLVERLRGAEVMTQTARFLLVDPPGREQRYYSLFSPRIGHGDEAILAVQKWLEETDAQETGLDALTARSGLEKRTFLRRFRKATGMTTSEYCQRLRVSKACEFLQFGALSIEQVAWHVGYGDTGAFRTIFTRFVGLSPSEYRQRFGAFS